MSFTKKILTYNGSLPVYLLIILLINVFLLQVPLAKVFGYEFSVINSVLLVYIPGFYFVSLLKKLKKNRDQKRILRRYGIIASAWFLFIPLTVSLTHSLITSGCSISEGLKFYMVITFPSILTGLSFACISVFIFKKFNKLVFVVITIIVLFIPIFEFYLNPQIYFYNPIFGFFPGTIYDEGVKVNLHLLLYRILNVLYLGLIAFVFYQCITGFIKISKSLLLVLIILTAAVFIYFSPHLGFSTNFEKLDSTLNGTVITKHFIIHFPVQLDRELVDAIILYHEYDYEELEKFFSYEYPQKINSYLFLNDEQKKQLFGTENADVSKPWMNCTFITYSDFSTTLKHELAHCYSSLFGWGIFKVAAGVNPYLTEGIAVAADPIIEGNRLDYLAALAYNNNVKADLNNLFNYFNFFNQASSISYIYAGSFSKYLIEKYGIEKFKTLYQTGEFRNSYGIPLENAVDGYYSTLADTNLSKRVDESNYYFGRKSIFYKICPRYAESRIKTAWSLFNKKDYPKAEKIFREIINVSNNFSAVIGYADCLEKSDSIDAALEFLLGYRDQFKNSAYYYSLELKLGDLFCLDSNKMSADSLYKELTNQNPNPAYYYLSNLRHDLLPADSLIIPYLKGSDFDKFYLLKTYNELKYNYYSIPVLIDLADGFNENYKLFMTTFHNTFEVENFAASYAAYKLSNYMLNHLDFERARKIAALAVRFKADKNFNYIFESNYNKINWFYINCKDVLNNSKFIYSNDR